MIEQTSHQADICANGDVETGGFAPTKTRVSQVSRLVIATFNIRYAVGSRLISGSLMRKLGLSLPGRRPALVANHIRLAGRALSDGDSLPPVDILALQEADKETARAGGHHVARELARELQMLYAHAATNIPRDEVPKPKQWYLDFEEHIGSDDAGDTGIALLSRWPPAKIERLDLPWQECAWRPRLALAATIPVGPTELHIFNSHIDPHAGIDEQLAQHAAILARADEAAGPTILLGDFNTLTRSACARVRSFLESRGYSTPFRMGTATWRSGPIRLQPDWIFVRDVKVTRSGVARRLSVSDHWPVWVEIELK
ncbi:MAG TPA: endonuclease/exonuclease/phosphatase family protein [Pyrinomonadaceae bacterium]|jgi:endonuclease/exonuclease/phosphatase family metal-dependent hydrolase